MPKFPYPYEVNGKLVTGNGSLNTNLFLIELFLIANFDCSSKLKEKYGGRKLLKCEGSLSGIAIAAQCKGPPSDHTPRKRPMTLQIAICPTDHIHPPHPPQR